MKDQLLADSSRKSNRPAARFRERGLGEADAETEATRRVGNILVAREEMRDARVARWLASSLEDLRHGLFLLRRDPGVSGLIVLVLALGIGGNAAVFTLLKAAFLDPLPYRDSSRLVNVVENDGLIPTVSEFLEIRKHTHTLEEMAFAQYRDMQLGGTGEPTRVFAARVTASFFPLLGVNPSLGPNVPRRRESAGIAAGNHLKQRLLALADGVGPRRSRAHVAPRWPARSSRGRASSRFPFRLSHDGRAGAG